MIPHHQDPVTAGQSCVNALSTAREPRYRLSYLSYMTALSFDPPRSIADKEPGDHGGEHRPAPGRGLRGGRLVRDELAEGIAPSDRPAHQAHDRARRLRCSGRANHRDAVTPSHLPGGKAGSGPSPGRE